MKNVLIIDSGSGGVNILSKCVKRCPCNNYLLYIDDKNAPYGEKSNENLNKIATQILREVSSFFYPEIVVIGCNTLTSVTISSLRQQFKDIFFIGAEPALNPALKSFDRESILVLATQVTIKNSKVLRGFEDICFAPKDLPKIIDNNLFNREEIVNYLKDFLPKNSYKAVVLGCTHFEGIKDEITKVFGSVNFFESGEGIAKRLSEICDKEESYQIKIMTSGDGENLNLFYSYFLRLMS